MQRNGQRQADSILAQLRHEYAIMALQRNTKILGIFVRLFQRDNKPVYLKHLPRIEAYAARTLSNPGLERLAAFYADMGLTAATN